MRDIQGSRRQPNPELCRKWLDEIIKLTYNVRTTAGSDAKGLVWRLAGMYDWAFEATPEAWTGHVKAFENDLRGLKTRFRKYRAEGCPDAWGWPYEGAVRFERKFSKAPDRKEIQDDVRKRVRTAGIAGTVSFVTSTGPAFVDEAGMVRLDMYIGMYVPVAA